MSSEQEYLPYFKPYLPYGAYGGRVVGTKSPRQALILLSEDSPSFVCGTLSETLARSLAVQDFWCLPR